MLPAYCLRGLKLFAETLRENIANGFDRLHIALSGNIRCYWLVHPPVLPDLISALTLLQDRQKKSGQPIKSDTGPLFVGRLFLLLGLLFV